MANNRLQRRRCRASHTPHGAERRFDVRVLLVSKGLSMMFRSPHAAFWSDLASVASMAKVTVTDVTFVDDEAVVVIGRDSSSLMQKLVVPTQIVSDTFCSIRFESQLRQRQDRSHCSSSRQARGRC